MDTAILGRQKKAKGSRAKPKATGLQEPRKALSIDEKFVLRMTLDRSVPWAQIYSKAVDKLFDRKLIQWKYQDSRGAYYSSIIATNEGRTVYEKSVSSDISM